ncbi:hypothetical protein OVN20_12820 [Microcella daejeonensis]|uniref:hypothetical protein n=1 Tax=Microcella daejeonensis TaxID=2994971 RepID=UPI002270E457|nr:hypothetical protein [Microcella daejeonensis]WAB83894.1 hypothetical protein OVN20_12820 [Microcella daejeonensis]
MSAEPAVETWARVLDDLERRIPPAPSLVALIAADAGEPARAPVELPLTDGPAWQAPAGAGAMPAQLAERARGILALIEERARQTRDVQQEIERHRGALRETAPRPSTTPLLLDRSA